jgi:hypothetical protein
VRKPTRVHWEILSQLDEAGEEDICSLLNEVMRTRPSFGSGTDLAEYLEAISDLESAQKLRVREYRIEPGNTAFGDVLVGPATRPAGAFGFDQSERIWRWRGAARLMVEVPDPT